MKIEYIYEDDTYKDLIKDIVLDKNVLLEETNDNNLHIFSISMELNNEEVAKIMSSTNCIITEKLDKKKFFILVDEASEYFNKRLYPICNEFERKLRKLLYIVCMQEGKGKDFIKEIEEKTFGEIYEMLFTSSDFVKEIKTRINNEKLSKHDVVKFIENMQEETLWTKLIDETKGNYISENFYEIKDYRNDVMHAHNMKFDTYREATKKLSAGIACINKLIIFYSTGQTEENSKYILNTVGSYFKMAKDLANKMAEYQKMMEPLVKLTMSLPKITSFDMPSSNCAENSDTTSQGKETKNETNEIDNEKLLSDESNENDNGETSDVD